VLEISSKRIAVASIAIHNLQTEPTMIHTQKHRLENNAIIHFMLKVSFAIAPKAKSYPS
jgi:hypothetical protein